MDIEFELSEAIFGSKLDGKNTGITRDIIMQYISAGILFPDEIRLAEQILRRLNES
jgi:hypothetical protein